MIRRLIIVAVALGLIFGCSDDKDKIYEPVVNADSISFPFESKKSGKFIAVYRNNSDKSIPFTFAYVKQGEILENSQKYDFCPEIMNIREGINTTDWILINHNYSLIPEDAVPNPIDHPNMISYSLPLGTWIAFLMEGKQCNKDQYEVIDILTNEATNQ